MLSGTEGRRNHCGGLRVQKAVSGGTTTVYIFSGSQVIAEYENGAAVGSPSREYVYAGGALVAKFEATTTTYYHPDHLSNLVLTESSGKVVGQTGHFPFGESWYVSGTDTKLKFTTNERDGETGLDYAFARYYNARLGRFMSADPLGGSPSDPQSFNRYAYVGNNPANLTDPSGMRWRWWEIPDASPGPSTYTEFSGWNSLSALSVPVFQLDDPVYGRVQKGEKIEEGIFIPVEIVGFGGWQLPSDPTGPGGGSRASAYVDQNVLNKCVQDIFRVTAYAFKGSTPNGNGYFIGYGTDAISPSRGGRGGAKGLIVVTNDATSYTSAQLNVLAGAPLPPNSTTTGLTYPAFPYNNFTNSNNNAIGTLISQVHELGHSLFRITSGLSPFLPETESDPDYYGHALEDCVKRYHGFRRN